MKMIDAAAVEAIFELRDDSRIDDDETQKRIEALLATAVEAEPVAEDGLMVDLIAFGRLGEYRIVPQTDTGGYAVFHENYQGYMKRLSLAGTFGCSSAEHAALFPSILAARAALAAALKQAGDE